MTKTQRITKTQKTQKEASTSPTPPDTAAGSKDVAFSVRLTTEEHDLLKRAAALRGWTPTNLIRTATLEKAAHIINTSTQRRLDFRSLAMEAASRLFGERKAHAFDEGHRVSATVFDSLSPLDAMELSEDEIPVEVEPKAMTLQQLDELTRAARYGGTEFLNMIMDACSSITAPNRPDLPEPIDPSAN